MAHTHIHTYVYMSVSWHTHTHICIYECIIKKVFESNLECILVIIFSKKYVVKIVLNSYRIISYFIVIIMNEINEDENRSFNKIKGLSCICVMKQTAYIKLESMINK